MSNSTVKATVKKRLSASMRRRKAPAVLWLLAGSLTSWDSTTEQPKFWGAGIGQRVRGKCIRAAIHRILWKERSPL